MRISDWSSDVCSADLLHLAVFGAILSAPAVKPEIDMPETVEVRFVEIADEVVEAAPAIEQVEEIKEVVPPEPPPPEPPPPEPEPEVMPDPEPEIGRASCRDRVCLSVSNEVGAVSLKKKKKTDR